jgi:hypothetical protein
VRRNIAILFLSWATALTAASCGSATDTTSTGASTTVAAGKTTTTKAGAQGSMDQKKCTAIDGFLQSYLIAGRDESKDPANQEKVLKGLTNTAATLKKTVPSMAAEVDTITAYATKLIKGEETTAAEKDATDKAKDKLNFFKNSCPKTGGGATPTTKAGAKPTTTTAAP